MRTRGLSGSILIAAALAAAMACEEDNSFAPGGAGGSFRILWPSTATPVEDAETFAIAVFPITTANPVTFEASVDGGADISGLRNGTDSLVAFPLEGLTGGSHSITVRVSSGGVLTRTFNVSLAPRPSITEVTPDTAVLGANQQITITGTGFVANSQQMRVYLNGVRLPIAETPTTTELMATVQGTELHSGLLSVATAVTADERRVTRELVPFRIVGGTEPSPDQAEVLLADPSSAPRNAPVVLYGRAFGAGDTPLFGSVNSSPIILLGSENVGLGVGLVQSGLTIVPSLASRGDVFVSVETAAGNDTGFPFFVR